MANDKDRHHPDKHRPAESEHLSGIERAAYGDDSIHRIHQQLNREKEEPTEGFSQIPIILLFLFGLLMFWGGVYIANHSAEFRFDIYDPDWKPGFSGDQTAAAWDPMKRGSASLRTTVRLATRPTPRGFLVSFLPWQRRPMLLVTTTYSSKFSCAV